VTAALLASLAVFLERPPAWVEAFGYTLVALVGLEMVVGKKRLHFGRRGFRRTHVAIAWTLAALLGVHAFIGIGHAAIGYVLRATSVAGPAVRQVASVAPSAAAHLHLYVPASVDNLPIWLDLNGALIFVLFGFQALSGTGKFHLKRQQFLGLHSSVAWLITIAAGVHGVLATVHLIVG
jgi:hypothetical protein